MIFIGTPIRNRAFLLPYFLRHIYLSGFPLEKMYFYFLLNDSVDNSKRILSVFRDRVAKGPVVIEEHNFNDGSGWTRHRQNYYNFKNLAILRNKILSAFLETDASHLLSIDSDVMIGPGAIQRLIDYNVDMVSSLIYNSYHLDESGHGFPTYNIMNKVGGLYRHIIPRPGLNPCDLTGAVVLIKRRVIEAGCRFDENNPGAQGEDQSFCESVRSKGFKIYYSGDVRSFHIMTPRQYEELKKGILRF